MNTQMRPSKLVAAAQSAVMLPKFNCFQSFRSLNPKQIATQSIPHNPHRVPKRDVCLKSASDAAPEPVETTSLSSDSEWDMEAPSRNPRFLGLSFQDVYYYLNLSYWTLLLLSVLIGNPILERITHFEVYTTANFMVSVVFTGWFAIKWFRDMRLNYQRQGKKDLSAMIGYSWNTLFWLGFVLWYATPAYSVVTEVTGSFGAIMCLYGVTLSLSAALTAGMFSFLGHPQIPKRLITTGPYSLLRHPQALGNMLFLIGFSLAGGAVFASASFAIAFILYTKTVVPKEEAMLAKAFGTKYDHYRERVPAFSWALVLLLIVEAFLLWRYAPFATTIDVRSMRA